MVPVFFGLLCIIAKSIQARSTEDNSTQCEVTEYPDEDDSGPETFIVICLTIFLRNGFFLLGRLLGESQQFCLILSVEVTVIRRDVDVDLSARFEVS